MTHPVPILFAAMALTLAGVASAQSISTPDPLGREQPTHRNVEVMPPVELGAIADSGVVSARHVTFRANFVALGEIVSWNWINPITSRGVELTLPWRAAPGLVEMELAYPSRFAILAPLTLPQCVPELEGWTPIFLSQVGAAYRVGIWQNLTAQPVERAVILFAHDYRCGGADSPDIRYARLLQGPVRWRYAEVRHIHHSGTSIGLVSETGRDSSVTVATLALSPSPLPMQ